MFYIFPAIKVVYLFYSLTVNLFQAFITTLILAFFACLDYLAVTIGIQVIISILILAVPTLVVGVDFNLCASKYDSYAIIGYADNLKVSIFPQCQRAQPLLLLELGQIVYLYQGKAPESQCLPCQNLEGF